MDELNKIVLNYLQSQYTFELGVSNIIDVKTSIIMALALFLAIHWLEILKSSSMSDWWRKFQYVSGGVIVVAILCAAVELTPRYYPTKRSSVEFVRWVEELKKAHAGETNLESRIIEDIRSDEINDSRGVFDQHRINDWKILEMTLSFWFTAAGLVLNVITQFVVSKASQTRARVM